MSARSFGYFSIMRKVTKKKFLYLCGFKKVSLNFKPTILWEEHLNLEKQENLNVGVTWPEPLPA